MIDSNKTLLDIYDFARKKRNEIAKENNEDFADNFGAIRQPSKYEFDADQFTENSFAGASPSNSNELFRSICEILIAEKHIFNRTQINAFFQSENYSYKPKKGLEIYEYNLPPDKSAQGMGVKFYSEYHVDDDKLKIREVIIPRGEMNDSIYKEKLTEFNLQLNDIKNMSSEPYQTLFKIGCLSHDLSRSVFLKRGSAAVNGFIIRSLLLKKNFAIPSLIIHGVSFDVYALMQPDREKYAKEFTASIMAELKLSFDAKSNEVSQKGFPSP